MSVTLIHKSSAVSAVQSQPSIAQPKAKSCFDSTAQWVRSCEKGGLFARVSIFVLKLIATVVLCGSIIGIPLFLALHRSCILLDAEDSLAAKLTGSAAAQINSLKERLAIADETAKVTNREFETLKDYLKELRNEKRELDELVSKLSKAKETLFGQLAHTSELNKELSARLEETTARYEQLQAGFGKLSQQLDSLYTASEKMKAELTKDRDALVANLESQGMTIIDLRAKRENLTKQFDALRKEIGSLAADNAVLKLQNADLLASLANSAADFERRLKKFQSSLGRRNLEVTERDATIQELRQRNEVLHKEGEDARQQLAEANRKIADFNKDQGVFIRKWGSLIDTGNATREQLVARVQELEQANAGRTLSKSGTPRGTGSLSVPASPVHTVSPRTSLV